jgi:hypothetical protein
MHFVYEDCAGTDLKQGDVLRRTPQVDLLLANVHPHYTSSEYMFFIVLSQSCDLVRRDGMQCKTRYISIAAARSLSVVFKRFVEKLFTDPLEKQLRFCSENRKSKLKEFAGRLANNNESPYFFLRREPSVGLDDDYCAFLPLSIAVKSELHYETLIAARVVSLKESFQHKLGYLTGLLYSRPGTEDWKAGDDLDRFLQAPLDDPSLAIWVDQGRHSQLLRKLRAKKDPTEKDLLEAVEELKNAKLSNKKNLLEALSEVLVECGIAPQTAQTVCNRLENRPEFAVGVK